MRSSEASAPGVDAHVIACFDDTGLDAARSLAAAPVVGIGEAADHLASLVAGRFTVVTTLSRSIPILERNSTAMAWRLAVAASAAEIPALVATSVAIPPQERRAVGPILPALRRLWLALDG